MYSIDEIIQMMSGIVYGWVDQYGGVHDGVTGNFSEDYRLQSPESVEASGVGTCWDQVEIERKYFEGYQTQTYFMVYYGSDQLPTHTFLVYEQGVWFYWFEHSWEKFRGIRRYKSLQELLEDVKRRFMEYEVPDCVSSDVVLYEYTVPDFGCTVGEFFDHCAAEDNKVASSILITAQAKSNSEVSAKLSSHVDQIIDNFSKVLLMPDHTAYNHWKGEIVTQISHVDKVGTKKNPTTTQIYTWTYGESRDSVLDLRQSKIRIQNLSHEYHYNINVNPKTFMDTLDFCCKEYFHWLSNQLSRRGRISRVDAFREIDRILQSVKSLY